MNITVINNKSTTTFLNRYNFRSFNFVHPFYNVLSYNTMSQNKTHLLVNVRLLMTSLITDIRNRELFSGVPSFYINFLFYCVFYEPVFSWVCILINFFLFGLGALNLVTTRCASYGSCKSMCYSIAKLTIWFCKIMLFSDKAIFNILPYNSPNWPSPHRQIQPILSSNWTKMIFYQKQYYQITLLTNNPKQS